MDSTAGWLMPALNADDIRQHTDWPFWEWGDDTGPGAALAQALTTLGPVGAVSLDEAMRADGALILYICWERQAVGVVPVYCLKAWAKAAC